MSNWRACSIRISVSNKFKGTVSICIKVQPTTWAQYQSFSHSKFYKFTRFDDIKVLTPETSHRNWRNIMSVKSKRKLGTLLPNFDGTIVWKVVYTFNVML